MLTRGKRKREVLPRALQNLVDGYARGFRGRACRVNMVPDLAFECIALLFNGWEKSRLADLVHEFGANNLFAYKDYLVFCTAPSTVPPSTSYLCLLSMRGLCCCFAVRRWKHLGAGLWFEDPASAQHLLLCESGIARPLSLAVDAIPYRIEQCLLGMPAWLIRYVAREEVVVRESNGTVARVANLSTLHARLRGEEVYYYRNDETWVVHNWRTGVIRTFPEPGRLCAILEDVVVFDTLLQIAVFDRYTCQLRCCLSRPGFPWCLTLRDGTLLAIIHESKVYQFDPALPKWKRVWCSRGPTITHACATSSGCLLRLSDNKLVLLK